MTTQPFTFDKSVFRRLNEELGTEDTAAVLQSFLADTDRKLVRLEGDDQTRSAIKREVHSLKSSAATFGFGELARLALALESGVEAMPTPLLRQSIHGLRREFEATRQFSQSNLLSAGSGLTI